MPILLDRNRGGNKYVFSKKISFKAVFLILPLHNSSKNIFLLLLFYLLIISSSFCLFAAGLNVDIFGKNNARKSKRDNPGTKPQKETNKDDNLSISTNTERKTGIDNPDVRVNNLDTAVDNSSIAINNSDIVTESLSTATNNLNTIVDNLGVIVDNLGIATDNLGIETDKDMKADNLSIKIDADIRTDNPGIAASNKVYVISFFALRHTFFFACLFFKIGDRLFLIFFTVFILKHFTVKTNIVILSDLGKARSPIF